MKRVSWHIADDRWGHPDADNPSAYSVQKQVISGIEVMRIDCMARIYVGSYHGCDVALTMHFEH